MSSPFPFKIFRKSFLIFSFWGPMCWTGLLGSRPGIGRYLFFALLYSGDMFLLTCRLLLRQTHPLLRKQSPFFFYPDMGLVKIQGFSDVQNRVLVIFANIGPPTVVRTGPIRSSQLVIIISYYQLLVIIIIHFLKYGSNDFYEAWQDVRH